MHFHWFIFAVAVYNYSNELWDFSLSFQLMLFSRASPARLKAYVHHACMQAFSDVQTLLRSECDMNIHEILWRLKDATLNLLISFGECMTVCGCVHPVYISSVGFRGRFVSRQNDWLLENM